MNPSSRRFRIASPLFFAMALALLSPAAMGRQPSDAQVDRLTDILVDMLPLGPVLDEAQRVDVQWPLKESAGSVKPGQLACMRKELSSEGYRRSKRNLVLAYAQANSSRLDNDIKLLTDGAAPLFGNLVAGGIAAGQKGTEFDPKEAMKSATPEQFLSFMTFMIEPKHAPLRELSGIGDAFNPTHSTQENEKAGEGLGASLVIKLMVGAMSTCDVPPSTLF